MARTIDSWRSELLAYFDTGGVSNGPTEAVNLLIKKIKRVGHGSRNFDNYRLRLLLHCGVDWDTIPATRSEVGYHAQPREPDWRLSARALIAAQFTTEGRVSCLITR